MALKQKEIAISKACSVKLDNGLIGIVAHVYHTADRKSNPEDKSWYKYVCRVEKEADLKAEAEDKKKPENRLKLWTWKCDAWPADWFFSYANGNEQIKEARWLEMKMKKALDWDAYVKLVTTGTKTVAALKCEKQYPKAAYEVNGYTDKSGAQFDITSKADLAKLVGKTVWKDCPLKRAQKSED